MLLLEFGDIFVYDDKEYVYLANIDSILYAALVIGPHQAKSLISARDGNVKSEGVANTLAKPIFCFVELRTQGYEEHIASLARTDDDKESGRILHGQDDKLCYEDLVEMKSEILDGNLPAALKEHFKTIEIAARDDETPSSVASFSAATNSLD